jgi:hypothetical protein
VGRDPDTDVALLRVELDTLVPAPFRTDLSRLAPGDPVRFFHHGKGRELEVHRSFFEGMARLEVDREPPRQSVVVIMGERDESVPFKGVEAAWRRWESSGRLAPGSRFVSIADGDHGLLGFIDQIAEAIRSS